MSNFKIGDLIVPNDKFYKTPSNTIGEEMGLTSSFIDGLKEVFNNNSSISAHMYITNISKDRKGIWLEVRCEGHPIAIDCDEIDNYSYLAEYFELYEEKKELSNIVLDYKLIDKLMWTTHTIKECGFTDDNS